MSDSKTPSIKVLAISGSLRAASYNGALVAGLKELAPEEVDVEIYGDVGSLPHFSEDLEGDNTPAEVIELRRRLGKADAVLISTPEYNGGMPGALKNLIDWASRPYGQSSFAGKPVAVTGTSVSPYGAQRAQEQLLSVLSAVGAVTVGEAHPVGSAPEVFAGDGSITDTGVVDLVKQLLSDLADAVAVGGAIGYQGQSDCPKYYRVILGDEHNAGSCARASEK